ncbi:unnamed protein product [Linum trigynum]|uniref:NHL repeat-containing protein n=1 Tax=Linum trigynum TaxID=586398 RepID=A0AAV2CPA4_9ROSI
MCRQLVAFTLIFLLLLNGFSSVSAATPAKIVTGIVTNVVSALVKWLWSLKSSPKTGTVSRLKGLMGGEAPPAVSGRSLVKFEDGYTVETVFDGSKLGIEPFSVQVSPSGELMVLDSENSNLYKMQTPLSEYSRPKLVAGSPEGYTGHVDGKLREAKMNHPKGLAADDKGNIYIADTMNMAIRKISEGGVTTIAGGKKNRAGGHIDGPSEEAKFSNDFDVLYVGSSCSLLVVDRGNQAIREIQLHDEDCSNYQDYSTFHLGNQNDSTFSLGVAMLVIAGFFGYMLALLQRKVQAFFSPRHDPRAYYVKKATPMPPPPYRRPSQSVRPPLIPSEDEHHDNNKPEDEGTFSSLGRLVGGLIPGFRRKPVVHHYQFHPQYQQLQQQQLKQLNSWPMQESYAIPGEDSPPPPLESTYLAPKRQYPFTTKELLQKNQHYNSEWDDTDYGRHQQQQQQLKHQHQQQQQQQMKQHQQQQQHHRQHKSNPKTYYEKGCETNEIVFGAVQEQDGRREAVVIKAVDYADPRYNHHNIRPRYNYVGYSHANYQS